MNMAVNSPDLWLADFPRPAAEGHKYDRGHALIYGGPEKTGAARLAAQACARMGAGLTTICAPAGKGDLYRMEIAPHLMVSENPLTLLAQDDRVTALCLGPGAGEGVARAVSEALSLKKTCVLDADALSAFAGQADALFAHIHPAAVMTPHAGEYKRLFGDIPVPEAARKAGCIVLLKGPLTIIAQPGGNTISHHADAPYLASAGTGDVLAGMITGLLAQGMDPFKAAAAAVWIHAFIGQTLGAGLVASDLPGHIPAVLKRLGL